MNTPRIRLIIAFILLVIGLVLNVFVGISASIYLYAAAIFFIIIHYKFGAVWPAFKLLQSGEIDKADSILKDIKKPDWLAKKHKAYYHFTTGMIYVQRKQNPPGVLHLKSALNLGLRNATDNALAAINLAHLYYVDQNNEASKKYLQQAIDFNSSDLLIKENIDKLQQALS